MPADFPSARPRSPRSAQAQDFERLRGARDLQPAVGQEPLPSSSDDESLTPPLPRRASGPIRGLVERGDLGDVTFELPPGGRSEESDAQAYLRLRQQRQRQLQPALGADKLPPPIVHPSHYRPEDPKPIVRTNTKASSLQGGDIDFARMPAAPYGEIGALLNEASHHQHETRTAQVLYARRALAVLRHPRSWRENDHDPRIHAHSKAVKSVLKGYTDKGDSPNASHLLAIVKDLRAVRPAAGSQEDSVDPAVFKGAVRPEKIAPNLFTATELRCGLTASLVEDIPRQWVAHWIDHQNKKASLEKKRAALEKRRDEAAEPRHRSFGSLFKRKSVAPSAAEWQRQEDRENKLEKTNEAAKKEILHIQEHCFIAINDLWNDHRNSGETLLTAPQRLLLSDQLAALALSTTQFTDKAAELRAKLTDPEVIRLGNERRQPLPPFGTKPLLNLSDAKPLFGKSGASQRQTRAAAFIFHQRQLYRVKDIKYGNMRAGSEVVAGLVTAMVGLTAPVTTLADHSHKLFKPSKVSRNDFIQHRKHPERFAAVASPISNGFQDLGDLATNAKLMIPEIKKYRTDKEFKAYKTAHRQFDIAYKEEQRLLDELKAPEKAVIVKKIETEVKAQKHARVVFDKEVDGFPVALKRAHVDFVEQTEEQKKNHIRVRQPIGEFIPARATELSEEHKEKLAALNARDKELRAAEEATDKLADQELKDVRTARKKVYDSRIAMIRQFPEHLQDQIINMHIVSRLTKNFDEYNWALANTGFVAIGDSKTWRMITVDHGNSLFDGFGGMQKDKSWERGNTRALIHDPIDPNFVALRDMQKGASLSVSGISDFQRALPIAPLLSRLISEETEGGLKIGPGMTQSLFMLYQISLIKEEHWKELFRAHWPSGAQFPSPPQPAGSEDTPHDADQAAQFVIDSAKELIANLPEGLLDKFKMNKANRAMVEKAHREVSASLAGLLHIYEDPNAPALIPDESVSAPASLKTGKSADPLRRRSLDALETAPLPIRSMSDPEAVTLSTGMGPLKGVSTDTQEQGGQ